MLRRAPTTAARMPRRLAGSAALLSVAAALLLVSACSSAPVVPLADFEAARSQSDLTRFMGRYPTACIEAAPGLDLCQWSLGNGQQAWQTLAPTVPTRRRLNVLCALPSDGGPRAPGSCQVHPQASQPFEAERRDEASRRRAAQRRLDAARTLVALSQLVGRLPDECRDALREQRICVWQVSKRMAGYELLATAAGADDRVRLECRLPADASPRGPDSCLTSTDR